MAVVGDLHSQSTWPCAQARGQPARARRGDGHPQRARRVHATQRRRVDLGVALERHRGLEPGRQGSVVRAGTEQGIPASDLLSDARIPAMDRDPLLFEYLLRLGDSPLILAQRLGEWIGRGPVLEEELGNANVALDLLGQARMWLSYA